jgi:hypothetical protein
VALVPVSHPEMDMLSLYTIDGRYSNESSYEKNAYTLYMKTEKKMPNKSSNLDNFKTISLPFSIEYRGRK